jgi:outer membrane cobalamin receptor
VERFLELTVMNFKIKSNPDLKAESCWAYDFGFRQYLTEEWNIDISLFDNEYWELIEAHMDLIRGQIQFRNIPRARIQGIEVITNFSTQFRLIGLKLKPGLQLSLTAMNHKELEYNDPLPYRPKAIGTAKATLKSGQFMFEADYRYASKIQEVKIYPINDRVPMKFIDLRLSYEWGPLTGQIGVDNLLQYNYAPMESNLMPMRTFTAGVKGEF